MRKHWRDSRRTLSACPFKSCSAELDDASEPKCFEKHLVACHYDNIAYLTVPDLPALISMFFPHNYVVGSAALEKVAFTAFFSQKLEIDDEGRIKSSQANAQEVRLLPKYITSLGYDFLCDKKPEKKETASSSPIVYFMDLPPEEVLRVEDLQGYFSFLHNYLTFILFDRVEGSGYLYSLHPSLESKEKHRAYMTERKVRYLQEKNEAQQRQLAEQS